MPSQDILKSKRVLGIDCGTAIVGWAVIDCLHGNKTKVIDYGDIRTPAKIPLSSRLKMIFDALSSLISKYHPTETAVEALFYFRNATTVISVGEARGVILLASECQGIPNYSYTPLQVKMAVTGYGRAEKKQVQAMVTKILGLKEVPKVDDTADALAIAVCHINSGANKARE